MSLGEIIAHADWRAIEARESAARTRWRAIAQAALIGYGATALLFSAVVPGKSWLVLALDILAAAVSLFLALQIVLRALPATRRAFLNAAAALAAGVILTLLTTPVSLRGPGWARIPALPPAWAAVIPLAAFGALAQGERRRPGLLHMLGLAGQQWARQAAIGLALGAALGYHLWLVVAAMPGLSRPAWPGLPVVIWMLAFLAGLRSLGEEVLVRGVLYRLLARSRSGMKLEAWARLILLNVVFYLAAALAAPRLTVALLVIAYGILFAFLATLLRRDWRSVIASLAANLAFNLFLLLVISS